MASVDVEEILNHAPRLLKIPFQRIWSSYDAGADMLYLSFKRPSHADDGELTYDDLILRYQDEEPVGITVLHASKRPVAR